jgi:hypothetical protein
MSERRESPAEVERWFRTRLLEVWPAGLGSLSLRRSPCIRSTCHVCETGEQHPSYVLYGQHGGRRFAVYVPDALVPAVRRLLANGRALQELLYETARRYTQALKSGRARSR